MVIFMLLLGVCCAYAQDTPDTFKEQAKSDFELAKQFSDRGRELLQNPVRDNLIIAIYLYTEAGKLYQASAGRYKFLASKYYITNDYYQAAESAVNGCLDAIRKCQERVRQIDSAKR